ncbi:hypothetical protein OSH11_06795 [Kaistia dalseonensis]|uniref:Uncharacterized protein n=1 Tax=Kaistia dalseonensis TaxID=410840 RepID=A0ABU0H3X0_9HYPH|nr:hypothetical protein [Kaistia dalseonensis]MCX5494401.1 hypothetical protein [Kaistia dalseonensis]MDQ0436980.1 hypothetical protein [Kaistia dalseonensis]
MARQDHQILDGSITGTLWLKAGLLYVVTSDVRVRKGATLVVEDGATILIQNGIVPSSEIRHAALIFEQGATLKAGRLFIRACDDRFRPVKQADNGGVWFFGAYRSAEKDGLSVTAAPATSASSFSAALIAAYYLGHRDPITESADPVNDDRDGFSLMGVGPQEWDVAEVRSYHSGDDGIDLTNSQIRLQRLRVVAPTEDGINLSSSTLQVARSLHVDVTMTSVFDRDIFDFETDDGPSYVEIAQHCHVDIRGVFGDQLHLKSPDMPAPNAADNESYRFKAFLRQSPALIYSLNED